MPEAAKVLKFDPVLSAREKSLLAKLPPAIQASREKSLMVVQALLSRFFDLSQDALFTLADNHDDVAEQAKLFDTNRKFRQQQPTFAQQFISSIDAGFAQLMAASAGTAKPPEPAPWQIPFEAEVNDVLAQHEAVLASINTRFGHLIDTEQKLHNPISPDYFAELFTSAVERLQMPNAALEAVVSSFAGCFFDNLEGLYIAIEALLDDHGIPQAKELDSHFASKYISQLSQRTTATRTPKADAQTSAIIENILGAQSSQQKLCRKDLLKVLDVAQRELGETTTVDQADALLVSLKQTQKRLNISGDFSSYDTELIKLICVMFEVVTRNDNLEPMIKGFVHRLLVPVIKVALLDKSFFAQSQHPTRELLNELVLSGLGWQQAQDPKYQSPVIKEINTITQHIAENFGTDTAVFTQALKRLKKNQAREDRQMSLLGARLAGTTHGKAKAAEAETLAATAISQRLEALKAPAVVKTFAEKLWKSVLVITALKHGKSSSQWQEQCSLLGDICRLATPCQSTKDKIKRSQLLPQIMPRIQQGIATCAHNAFDSAEILEALHSTLCDCLKGIEPAREYALKNNHKHEAPAPGSVEVAHSANRSHEATEEQPARSNKAQTQGDPATNTKLGPHNQSTQAASKATIKDSIKEKTPEFKPEDEMLVDQICRFPRGALFDWHEDNKRMIRCRLAAIIGQHERFIFINRNGIKVAEMSMLQLLQAIKSEQIQPIEHSMVFDRALETVVSGLRRNQDDNRPAG